MSQTTESFGTFFLKKNSSNVDEAQLIAYNSNRSGSFMRRLSEVPGSIKTEEIARRLSEVPGSIKTEEIDSKEHHFNDVLYLSLERTMAELVYIEKSYFEDHSNYQKMLDPGNVEKQQHRSYLCVEFIYGQNRFFIPLRNNLGEATRKFGKIGFAVPSKSRPEAGLDYRYMLIVNEEKYIERPTSQKVPESQKRMIDNNYDTIVAEATEYVRGYVKCASKNRVDREAKYRESSLINFYDELKIEKAENNKKK